jgi:carbon monoxide dehydrogenase subunit G
MLSFEGDRDVAVPPAELASKLSDARFLSECIPGIESVARSEPEVVVCTLRPGFSFVRGTLELTLRVAEAVPAQLVRLELHSKGIGSTSKVEVALALTPQESGTRAHWLVEVKELGGLLKAVPRTLIQGAAQSVIEDAWKIVESRLVAT